MLLCPQAGPGPRLAQSCGGCAGTAPPRRQRGAPRARRRPASGVRGPRPGQARGQLDSGNGPGPGDSIAPARDLSRALPLPRGALRVGDRRCPARPPAAPAAAMPAPQPLPGLRALSFPRQRSRTARGPGLAEGRGKERQRPAGSRAQAPGRGARGPGAAGARRPGRAGPARSHVGAVGSGAPGVGPLLCGGRAGLPSEPGPAAGQSGRAQRRQAAARRQPQRGAELEAGQAGDPERHLRGNRARPRPWVLAVCPGARRGRPCFAPPAPGDPARELAEGPAPPRRPWPRPRPRPRPAGLHP